MKRRTLLALGGLAVAAPAKLVQSAPAYRIGVLAVNPRLGMAAQMEALITSLHERGYVEGRNIAIEYRSGGLQAESLRAAAGELVAAKVDVIVTIGTPPSLAAKAVTTTVPVVMVGVGDPIGTGLVQSLARPGGNLTGTSNLSPPLVVKRLELLKECNADLRRAALLINPKNAAQAATVRAMDEAAAALKVDVKRYHASSTDDIRTALALMHEDRMEALVVSNDTVLIADAAAIAFLANKHHLPSAGNREFAEAGGLLGYGSIADVVRHAAAYVDKILKGAKPADLPIEQPSKYEVVLNARTAKIFGFSVPSAFRLLRVDRVIE